MPPSFHRVNDLARQPGERQAGGGRGQANQAGVKCTQAPTPDHMTQD
jgi:hypothetical protein